MTVILLMIDGLRPDALHVAPHLEALAGRSARTLRARSVMPSITLPCHMSIFHSIPPDRHGTTTNDWVPMARPVPGLMDVAYAAGLRCASFYNWEPLRNVSQPGSLYVSYYLGNEKEPGGDDIIGAVAAREILDHRPDFAFVYFATVDIAGHDYGWMTDEYLAQVTHVDGVAARLIEALSPLRPTLLIQADHGGHARTHGTDADDDMLVPWIITGERIRRDHMIGREVTLLDTAPTLATALGLQPHPAWEGRSVDEVFEP